MDILKEIKSKLDEFQDKKSELVSQLRSEFPSLVKPLFDKYPKVTSFSWNQYTPFFNDGDECTFSVNEVDKFNDFNEDEDETTSDISRFLKRNISKTITEDNLQEHVEFNTSGKEGSYNFYTKKGVGETGNFPNPEFDSELYAGSLQFKELISSIPEDFMKDLFGNHVEITVYSNGTVDIESYEHD